MSYSLRSPDHYLKVSKALSEDSVFSDLLFVTTTDTLYCHSALLLPLLPSLTSMLCQACSVHGRVYVMVPMVTTEELQGALLHLYMKGDVNRLKEVLGVEMDNIKEEVRVDIIDVNLELKHSENTNKISVIHYSKKESIRTEEIDIIDQSDEDTIYQDCEKMMIGSGLEDVMEEQEDENEDDFKEILNPNCMDVNLQEEKNYSSDTEPGHGHSSTETKTHKTCHFCAKAFTNSYNLKQHLISRHKVFPPEMRIYKCHLQVCSFVTGSRVAFERHLTTSLSHPNTKKKNKNKEKNNSCEFCNEQFATKSSLKRHIIRKHN